MRIGQRTNLLRAAARALRKYASHKSTCAATRNGTCGCGLTETLRDANAALAEDATHRGPPRQSLSDDAFGSFGAL